MNAMGFSAKPQSKRDQNSPFFCFLFVFFPFFLKEKFLFFGPREKKEATQSRQ
jgi:hypothetical protein